MSIITKNIDLAISCLRDEGIVAIPTETVYGLAGSAVNDNAIKKIFAMKNRPVNHPLIMHIAKDWELSRWVSDIPDYVDKLIETFWPGPLTIVLNSKPGTVSPLITGGQNTVAIRCPAHPIAQSLLTALDFPLVAPSANPFGKISPTTAAHVLHSFRDESLLILDGGRAEVGIESTIVSGTNPLGYQILRHGMIDEQAIEALLPQRQLKEASTIRVPGKLDSHYQPEKPLYCFEKKDLVNFCKRHPTLYVLSFDKDKDFKEFSGYQLPNNPVEFAYELYHQLRCADQSSAPLIAMELPPVDEEWEGIRERIVKASTKN